MSSPESIVDLTYLHELSKGNPQFVKDMIKIFLEENPAEIDMLRKGIESRDFNVINASAHKLKSTIPFVGIEKYIENEIAEIENLAMQRSTSDLPPDHTVVNKGSDNSVLQHIKKLFDRVNDVSIRACRELAGLYGAA